jgi:hypothetical protein
MLYWAVTAPGPYAPRLPSSNLDPTGQMYWAPSVWVTSAQDSHDTYRVERRNRREMGKGSGWGETQTDGENSYWCFIMQERGGCVSTCTCEDAAVPWGISKTCCKWTTAEAGT